MTTPQQGSASQEARSRIIDAGTRCVSRLGAHAASMSAIAEDAGVSKALLHYHFRDRAQLLSEVIARTGDALAARERGILDSGQPGSAVDMLWRWLEDELGRGELLALLELRTVRNPVVRTALERVTEMRRVSTTATVTTLFARLDLTVRVPAALIADAMIAFTDGLVLDHARDRNVRVSFDVFWLAMLSLAD